MIVSLKEAYKIAKKALPKDSRVKIEVSIGEGRWDSRRDPEQMQWEISVIAYTTKKGEEETSIDASEKDEVFSIALAKVSAEISRLHAKKADDVQIDESADKSDEEEEAPTLVPEEEGSTGVGF